MTKISVGFCIGSLLYLIALVYPLHLWNLPYGTGIAETDVAFGWIALTLLPFVVGVTWCLVDIWRKRLWGWQGLALCLTQAIPFFLSYGFVQTMHGLTVID